jgi:4-alpha-glucanotransferase
LLPESLAPVLNDGAPCPADFPDEGCVAVHALLAKAASRLVAVQVEDLVGMREQANVPGTVDEHPNWRRKLPIELDAIPKTDLFRDITQALAQERPRAP